MPKTWSNHHYDVIDLDRSRRKGMPFAGWVIFGVGGLAFVFICVLATIAISHPPITHENDATPLVMPSSAAAYHGN
jgi:hypothetical protein